MTANAALTVTAIVPVRDGARFLADALRSIVEQERPADEILVVDDGSCDESAAIARSFPGVRCLSQPAVGAAAARNRGVAAASGALVAFLDADDRWTPDKLRVQIAHLAAHPAVDYVLAHQCLHLEPGMTPPAWVRAGQLDAPSVGYLPSSLVARRELFTRVGPFDTSYRVVSDVDWFARAKDAGARMAILPQVLLHRRVHGRNLTTDIDANQAALLRTLRASIARQRSTKP